ncbi:isopeptide-forming domain-containing fimbrial protein [Mastigocoleus sp. MO_188.B34]|uniref:isopeptide-forming domain-containing fimbrial protein n=1 Tax=Mastigocoleus sp. MO_188.B34 TaxID=3036635 RepID=UPI002625CF88|nr:isopeptide-forming domain-containing fimbrial protein [Mastigocoleus sp. MO_188.B34]MDJ0695624.1 isopeptide-forming domain-containing fimbrial protein [Mastigocoleus sp. MO_188.B34]
MKFLLKYLQILSNKRKIRNANNKKNLDTNTGKEKLELYEIPKIANRQHSCSLSWFQRGVATLIPLAATLSLAPSVEAGGIARNFAIRYQVDQQGSIRIIGNSTMTCSDTSGSLIGYLYYNYGIPPINFSNSTCSGARNRSGGTNPAGDPGNINDAQYMVYVDTDGDSSTFSSSSSTFTLPANAKITFAGLYWSGTTDVVPDERFYGYSGDYDLYIPSGQAAPSAGLRNQVKFKVGSGAYQTLTATQLDTDADGTAGGTGGVYQGFVDVTNLVAEQAGGSTRTYTVGNIQSAQGQKGYGSWSLVVVYEDTTESMRNLTVYDGFIRQQNGDAPRSTTVSGFTTPTTGAIRAEAGVVAYEGDLDISGDQFLFNGISISDALNPSNEFWNSNATQFGSNISGRNPSYSNMFGTDINLIDVSGSVNNGDNSATLGFTTVGDQYYPGVFTFAVDIFRPELTRTFTKRAVDVNGGDFLPGEDIEYEISYTNTGNDGAADVVLSDSLPTGTTFVPGSLEIVADPEAANVGTKTDIAGDDEAEYDSANNRIIIRTGAGASATQGGLVDIGETVTVQFKVKIDPNFAAPDSLANQATINYESKTTSDTFSGTSDDPDTPEENDSTTITVSEAPVTNNPDVILVKRITAINGDRTQNPNDNTVLNTFVDDTVSTRKDDDNHSNWPSNYLLGALDAGKVKPGDEIEYTVYFLNSGAGNADNVKICDRLLPNQTFKNTAYGANADVQLQLGTSAVLDLTAANDASDRAEFIAAGGSIPANCFLKGANDDGTLVIDITGTTGSPNLSTMPGSTGSGTPNDSYGFFRFTTKVDP